MGPNEERLRSTVFEGLGDDLVYAIAVGLGVVAIIVATLYMR